METPALRGVDEKHDDAFDEFPRALYVEIMDKEARAGLDRSKSVAG